MKRTVLVMVLAAVFSALIGSCASTKVTAIQPGSPHSARMDRASMNEPETHHYAVTVPDGYLIVFTEGGITGIKLTDSIKKVNDGDYLAYASERHDDIKNIWIAPRLKIFIKAGTYYIAVTGRGYYTLHVECEPAPPYYYATLKNSDTTRIITDDPQTDRIVSVVPDTYDRHFYIITVPDGVIHANTEGTAVNMKLFDTAGRELYSSRYSSVRNIRANIFHSVIAGTYVIEVTGYNYGSGSYYLFVDGQSKEQLAKAAQDGAQSGAQIIAQGADLATQGAPAYTRATEHLIAGRIAEAIADYQAALNSGGLERYQTSEAQRILAIAQELQTASAALVRPLTDDDFQVTQNADNTITITGFKRETSRKVIIDRNERIITMVVPELVIPSRLYGLPVTIINERAFENKAIRSLVIPDTVTSVSGFAGCGLTSVTLGRNVRTIRSSAFQNNHLTQITIPDSVTEIGASAFRGCGLTSITWGRGLRSIGENAFTGNKLTNLNLPTGVQTIGQDAFRYNELTSVILSAGLQSIGTLSFGANRIETLVIPAGIVNVGNTLWSPAIFTGNPLTRVTLPANISDQDIGSYGFEQSLRNFYVSQNRAAGTYVKNGPIWTRQ